jgi:hypothetical protein
VLSWACQGERIVGDFTPRQIRRLRDHVGRLRDALVRHRDSPDAAAWCAAGARPAADLVPRMLADVDLVLGALPTTGGVVVLPDDRHVWAWIWSPHECGMHLAFRLARTWRRSYATTSPRSDRAEQVFAQGMAWLTRVVDGLIDTADLSFSVLRALGMNNMLNWACRSGRWCRGLTGPVHRDVTDQAMLDLVPLGGARWRVAHGDPGSPPRGSRLRRLRPSTCQALPRNIRFQYRNGRP